MNAKRWRINSRSVVSEIIDGELIVMDSANGKYFSSTGVGPVVWLCIERGMTNVEIHQVVAARCSVEVKAVASDIDEFITKLSLGGLCLETDFEPPTIESVACDRLFYSRPELSEYTDMQDLLLLDPIHEVSEEGWPVKPHEN